MLHQRGVNLHKKKGGNVTPKRVEEGFVARKLTNSGIDSSFCEPFHLLQLGRRTVNSVIICIALKLN
jgi:hypothetical protein